MMPESIKSPIEKFQSCKTDAPLGNPPNKDKKLIPVPISSSGFVWPVYFDLGNSFSITVYYPQNQHTALTAKIPS
jgi:hypothetical protein